MTGIRLALAFGLMSIALTRPLLAEDDESTVEAKKQFAAGTQAFGEKRFVEAAMAFEAAASYKPNAVALYTAALAWEQANIPERAADAYGRALELPGLTPQQIAKAKDRIAALEKTLGTIVVSGPDGAKVQLDGFTEAPVPVRLHGAVGAHVLTVRSPGKTPERRDVFLELGQAHALDVTPQAPKPKDDTVVAPPLTPTHDVVVVESQTPASWKKGLGFGLIGAGAVSGLASIVLGVSALDAGDAYKQAPTQASYDHANALATWTTVGFIVSGVFIAGGVTLLLLPDPKGEKKTQARLALVPSFGGGSLMGSF